MAVQNIFSLLILCTFATQVFSHSWVSCTDYRISNAGDTQTYVDSKCKGFGRAWSQCCENSAFGLDRGFNYQPGNGKLCRNPLDTGNGYQASYSSGSPMAKYAPGQQVCLAWAPKNHVAATCINKNIPDNGMEVYMSGANPSSDPTSLSQMTKIADWGKNPGADAYKGFHNCPNFCSNPDKATCTGCFYIPRGVQVGAVYTFVWTWEFNGLSDQYSTCWEAQIVSTIQGSAPTLPSGYYNIAPSTGVSPPPVASKPASSAPVRTSSPANPQDTDDLPVFTADPKETYEQQATLPIPRPTNYTVIYVFAGGNGMASWLHGYLVAFALFVTVVLWQ